MVKRPRPPVQAKNPAAKVAQSNKASQKAALMRVGRTGMIYKPRDK